MILRYLRPTAMLALGLMSALACAQWSARWDTTSSLDHKGIACAVDKRGNVYVAGPVVAGTNGTGSLIYEFGIVSYDENGGTRWSRVWQDAANDSAVPTGIAVDWEGNCYVSGVNNVIPGPPPPPSSPPKFVVVKFRASDGVTVWPNSGSGSGSGYTFNTGGIILTDSNLDGGGTHGRPWCAISMEDVPGSEPTFAITGPTNNGTTNLWRTAVFEADPNPTYGVRLKAGWPLDEFSSGDAESMAVAISSLDNSVYVTGRAHIDPVAEFVTVHYAAGGTLEPHPDLWQDHFHAPGKDAEGLSIAVDYLGTAYVTGYAIVSVGTDDVYEYETRELGRFSTTGNAGDPPDVHWHDEYWDALHPGINIGTSVNLSNEYSGTLRPYVYVTGLANSPASDLDIATFRYTSGSSGTGGVRQWSTEDRYNAHISPGNFSSADYWPSVLGAGLGNAYVIGSRYVSSDYDYILYGVTKTDTSRFSSVYNPYSHTDLGHYCATGGAGRMYFTGESKSLGSDLDFGTLQNQQTPQTVVPNLMAAWAGLGQQTNTTLYQVQGDDADYYQLTANQFTGKKTQLYMEVPISSTATELSLRVKGHVSIAGLREKVQIYSRRIADYQLVSDQSAATSDTTTVIPLKDDAAEYVDPSTGLAKVIVTYYGDVGLTNWTAYYGFIQLSTIN